MSETERTTPAPSSATPGPIVCPPWCAGSLEEHKFEAGHGFPVEHFLHLARDLELLPVVSLSQIVYPDGAIKTEVSVGDDPAMCMDVAERTAHAVLEVVKLARG